MPEGTKRGCQSPCDSPRSGPLPQLELEKVYNKVGIVLVFPKGLNEGTLTHTTSPLQKHGPLTLPLALSPEQSVIHLPPEHDELLPLHVRHYFVAITTHVAQNYDGIELHDAQNSTTAPLTSAPKDAGSVARRQEGSDERDICDCPPPHHASRRRAVAMGGGKQWAAESRSKL